MKKTFAVKVLRIVYDVAWIDVMANNEDDAWAFIEDGLDDGAYENDFNDHDAQTVEYHIAAVVPE